MTARHVLGFRSFFYHSVLLSAYMAKRRSDRGAWKHRSLQIGHVSRSYGLVNISRSVLDSQGVRVNSLLAASNPPRMPRSFLSHCIAKTAPLISTGPCQTDEMVLGLAKCRQCSKPRREHANCNRLSPLVGEHPVFVVLRETESGLLRCTSLSQFLPSFQESNPPSYVTL